ncbi:MAG: SAM-dependent methyltransferase [Myxococcota bacterium]|jgi:SAM-dependent methyltransferase
MTWWIGLLLAVFVLDALKLRGRATKLAAVELAAVEPDGGGATGYEAVAAPGVVVSNKLIRASADYARAQGLDALDVVPADMPALRALGLLQIYDPGSYRHKPFSTGRTAGHLVLATQDVLERAGRPDGSFTAWAARLIRYAPRAADLAVAPQLKTRPEKDADRYRLLSEAAGGLASAVLVVQPLMLALLVAAVLTDPIWGLVLVGVFNLQPLIALAGSPFKPSDLALVTALRPLLELDAWRRTMTAALTTRSDEPDPVEARREKYEAWVAEHGTGPFFEERREDCPLCAAQSLTTQLDVTDQYQYKPGRFRLDRCGECAHIFQNPRLTIEGLNYYYSDFYDGLGEAGLEGIFGWSDEPYLDRARMLQGIAVPESWLDVGTGHGHFCCAARDVWPDARFDGLDLSESIEEAERRRWVDRGYRGLFPDLAAEHAGNYDVVSMHHYLEHTREPGDEIAAAHTVLRDGGHLLIEVPDPDCKTGAQLGRFWLPWFQPQHQHFVSVANLDKLFAKHGFEAVTWHRGEAHQTVDLLFAAMIFFGGLAPNPSLPWRPRASVGQRVVHALVWTIGTPVCLISWGADQLLQGFFRRPGRSNTYRVLARRI